MSLISRITTWVSGQLLKSADLNGEFNNIVNTFNNLDAASTAWTSVKTGALTDTGNASITGTLAAGATTISGNLGFTTTSTQGILGSTTNDAAAAGNVGEYITGAGSGVAAGATTVMSNIASIVLSAGTWFVSGFAYAQTSGVTLTGLAAIDLSAFSGNTKTDEVGGVNSTLWTPVTGVLFSAGAIPIWRVTVASGTPTYYLKGQLTYAAGSPTWVGSIAAWRPR